MCMTLALWLHVAFDSWSMDVFSWIETSKLLTACRMWTGNVAIQFFILLDEWKKNQWAYCQLTVCKQFQTSAACRFIQFLNAVVVQQNVYRVVEPSLRNRWLLIHQSDWSDATLKLDVVWQPYFFFFQFHVHIRFFDLGLEEPFSHFQDFSYWKVGHWHANDTRWKENVCLGPLGPNEVRTHQGPDHC